jgi:hypothetical protein
MTENNNVEKVQTEYSTIASTEVRKIVTGLILAVFGLAYTKSGFIISDFLSLQIALSLFFVYLLLDIIHYLYGIHLEQKKKNIIEISDKVYPIFILKLSVAMLGLIFCGLNIFKIL